MPPAGTDAPTGAAGRGARTGAGIGAGAGRGGRCSAVVHSPARGGAVATRRPSSTATSSAWRSPIRHRDPASGRGRRHQRLHAATRPADVDEAVVRGHVRIRAAHAGVAGAPDHGRTRRQHPGPAGVDAGGPAQTGDAVADTGVVRHHRATPEPGRHDRLGAVDRPAVDEHGRAGAAERGGEVVHGGVAVAHPHGDLAPAPSSPSATTSTGSMLAMPVCVPGPSRNGRPSGE